MDTKLLKQKILDLAIRGKLVPQDPNDEPASVLLERIRTEKERLIAEGKIKRSKKSTKSSDKAYYENINFAVPENWIISTLSEVFYMHAGKSINASKIANENSKQYQYPCIGGNGIRGYVVDYNAEGEYPIIGRQGALCGNINYIKGKFYATEHAVIVDTYGNTNVKWAYFFLQQLNLNQFATATAQPGLSVAKIGDVQIPLPPLNEQLRIVSEIENWFTIIDDLEANKQALQDVIKQTKSKVLDLAIHGKLVPQDPTDEPASELLKRINPNAEPCDTSHYGNLPFIVPNNWVCVRLSDICKFLSRGKSPKYSDNIKIYPVFAQKCNLFDGDISLEKARFLDPKTLSKWGEEYKLRDGDVLMNSTGTGTVCRTRLFRSDILGEYPFVVPDSHVSVIRTYDEIDSKFVHAFLTSRTVQNYLEDNLAGSTNQRELYIGVLGDLVFPLAPINEQKRIVQAINYIELQLQAISAEL